MLTESFHLVEDATGLLDLGKYVLDVYLGVCLSNSRTLALFPLVLNWFFVLDELLLRMGNELLRCGLRPVVLICLLSVQEDGFKVFFVKDGCLVELVYIGFANGFKYILACLWIHSANRENSPLGNVLGCASKCSNHLLRSFSSR